MIDVEVNEKAEAGRSKHLRCEVEKSASSMVEVSLSRITWYKDSHPLAVTDRYYFMNRWSEINIVELTKMDSGFYQCTVDGQNLSSLTDHNGYNMKVKRMYHM